jgi:hypothetical protein
MTRTLFVTVGMDKITITMLEVAPVDMDMDEEFEDFFGDNDLDPALFGITPEMGPSDDALDALDGISSLFNAMIPPNYAADYDPSKGAIVKQNKFVANIASALMINPGDIKVTNIVPGNRRRLLNEDEAPIGSRRLQTGGIQVQFELVESDPCQTMNCNHGTCDKGACECEANWVGMHCSSNPCLGIDCGYGSCMSINENSTLCVCDRGWAGRSCDVDVDECANRPCMNDGVCINDETSGYTCDCTPGWTGTDCDKSTDDCFSFPCENGGNCADLHQAFRCTCINGWYGDTCEDMGNICTSQQNNCDSTASCVVPAFSDPVCMCAVGYDTNDDGQNCFQVDECTSNPCAHGNCIDGILLFHCDCHAGYLGQQCDVDIDECSSQPCVNDAECSDAVDAYVCACSDLWTGDNCAVTTIVANVTNASDTFGELLGSAGTMISKAQNGTLDTGYDVTAMGVELPPDACGVPGGDGTTCADQCGVPNGDDSTCKDVCGVVKGDGSTCAGDSSTADSFDVDNCATTERQRVQLSGIAAMGGQLTITFGDAYTYFSIPFASTGDIENSLGGMDTVGSVAVYGLLTDGAVGTRDLLLDTAVVDFVVEFTSNDEPPNNGQQALLGVDVSQLAANPTSPQPFVQRICPAVLPDGVTCEVQRIVLSQALSGTFKISLGGAQSADISVDASSSAVRAAIDLLNTVDSRAVDVTSNDAGTSKRWDVRFCPSESMSLLIDASDGGNVAELELDTTSAVFADGGSGSVSQTTAGVVPTSWLPPPPPPPPPPPVSTLRTSLIFVDMTDASVGVEGSARRLSFESSFKTVVAEALTARWLASGAAGINVAKCVDVMWTGTEQECQDSLGTCGHPADATTAATCTGTFDSTATFVAAAPSGYDGPTTDDITITSISSGRRRLQAAGGLVVTFTVETPLTVGGDAEAALVSLTAAEQDLPVVVDSAPTCIETAILAQSVSEDLAACNAVLTLADAVACEEVMTSLETDDENLGACTYTASIATTFTSSTSRCDPTQLHSAPTASLRLGRCRPTLILRCVMAAGTVTASSYGCSDSLVPAQYD